MSQSIDLQEIRHQALQFPEQFKSVQLATCTKEGIPEASYACYLFQEGKYYLYLSRLASHFNNIATNPICSLLFIEDEDKAKQLFARRRLTIQCDAQIITRGSEHFNQIMDGFAERFGNFMKAVRDLTDFELFELNPKQGSFVAGFAQTYRLSGKDFSDIHMVGPDKR